MRNEVYVMIQLNRVSLLDDSQWVVLPMHYGTFATTKEPTVASRWQLLLNWSRSVKQRKSTVLEAVIPARTNSWHS